MRVTTRLIWSAVLVSGTIAINPAAEARSIKLATCDYTGIAALASDPSPFIATHFDWMIISGGGTSGVVAALKGQNPNLKIFGYHDATLTQQTNLPSDMYFYDPDSSSNHDQVVFLNPFYLLLDPNSQDRRNYAVNTINGFFGAGYDGVMLDNVWYDPTGHATIWPNQGIQRMMQYDPP